MMHPSVCVIRQPGSRGSRPDQYTTHRYREVFMGTAHLCYILIPAVVVVILGALLVCPMNPWCCLRCK